MDAPPTLRFAIPKGSLQEPTIDLLAKAGYEVYVSSRGLRPASNDRELDLYLIRAQEIGRYLGQGFIDCGITGYDWAYENGVDLVDLAELPYSRATTRPTRWVLVVPEDSPIRKPEDLEGKRIATEGVGITQRYLKERGIKAGPIIHPARMAVSGKTKGAGLFEMMEVLGRERVVARMRRAANGT